MEVESCQFLLSMKSSLENPSPAECLILSCRWLLLLFKRCLSSRVDYLKDCDNLAEKVDQQQPFKTRNSGLCIATGTGEQDLSPKIHHSTSNLIRSGSTSWIFNVNKMAHHAVESLLKITFETTRSAELIYSYGEVIEEALRQVPPELEGPQVG